MILQAPWRRLQSYNASLNHRKIKKIIITWRDERGGLRWQGEAPRFGIGIGIIGNKVWVLSPEETKEGGLGWRGEAPRLFGWIPRCTLPCSPGSDGGFKFPIFFIYFGQRAFARPWKARPECSMFNFGLIDLVGPVFFERRLDQDRRWFLGTLNSVTQMPGFESQKKQWIFGSKLENRLSSPVHYGTLKSATRMPGFWRAAHIPGLSPSDGGWGTSERQHMWYRLDLCRFMSRFTVKQD